MKWVKNDSLEDILIKVVSINIMLKSQNSDYDSISELFYSTISNLSLKKIIKHFENVVGFRIEKWKEIKKSKNLLKWIYDHENEIIENIINEILKKTKNPRGKNLFMIKCMYKNQTNVERCLP